MGAGAARQQFAIEHDAARRPCGLLDALQQQLDRGAADLERGLGDDGDPRRQQRGPVVVVESGQREICGSEAAKPAAVLGLSFITEGAIPFAARDPLRVIPACMLGSATAGGLSMGLSVALQAPHGGVFVLAIPNAVNHLLPYVLAIAAGMAVTALALGVLERRLVPVAAA